MNLDFEPFPLLTTNRFVLRELVLGDAAEIFFLRSDKRVLKFIGKEPAVEIQEAVDFIKNIIKNRVEKKGLMWGIALQEAEKLIGNICYWNINEENETLEIGYSLHPDFHNQGVMHEVFGPVLKYAEEVIKVKKIEAFTHENNIASRKLLEKNLFKRDPDLERYHVGISDPATTVIYSRRFA